MPEEGDIEARIHTAQTDDCAEIINNENSCEMSELPVVPANAALHIITTPILFVHSLFRNYGRHIRYIMKYGFMIFWIIYLIAALSVSDKQAAPLLVLTLLVYGYLIYENTGLKDSSEKTITSIII